MIKDASSNAWMGYDQHGELGPISKRGFDLIPRGGKQKGRLCGHVDTATNMMKYFDLGIAQNDSAFAIIHDSNNSLQWCI